MTPNPSNIILVTGKDPWCIWDSECDDHNREFLSNFDPHLYFSTCEMLYPSVENPDKRDHAAAAIRMQYGLALETHFSLLLAAAQAPSATYAWLPKCTNQSLRSLVSSVNNNEPILSSWHYPVSGWKSILDLLLPEATEVQGFSRDTYLSLRDGYLKLWQHLGRAFVNDTYVSEYNAFKHGGRANVGRGALLKISKSKDFKEIIELGGGDFGSTHMRIKKHPKLAKHNQICSIVSTNWDPTKLCRLVELMAESTSMIKNSLMHQLRYESTFEFRALTERGVFDDAIEPQDTLGSFELTLGYRTDGPAHTKSEIIEEHRAFRTSASASSEDSRDAAWEA